MSASIRLVMPLLRTTLRWPAWLAMALAALYAVTTDSAGIGLGASAGAAALLALSACFGLNLKRCRARAISWVLPSFASNGLLAVAATLVCLVAVVGALDGWRPGSLLAISVAAALGLGAGLTIPPRWLIVLAWAPILWLSAGYRDLVLLWTSAWSAWLAASWLLLGLFDYWRTRARDRSPRFEWELTPGNRAPARGTDPYRSGYLLSPWRPLLGLAIGSMIVMALLHSAAGAALFAEIGPTRQPTLVGYLVLFSWIGFLASLFELLSSGLRTLRRLAVLPGWGRDRLFAHAELSCWRVATWLLLALCLALLATGAWAGQPTWGLWLNGLLVWAIAITLTIYAGLWVACMPGVLARILALTIIVFPLMLIVGSILFDLDHQAANRSTWFGPLGLAASGILAWWLRHQARCAWASISFNRDLDQ